MDSIDFIWLWFNLVFPPDDIRNSGEANKLEVKELLLLPKYFWSWNVQLFLEFSGDLNNLALRTPFFFFTSISRLPSLLVCEMWTRQLYDFCAGFWIWRCKHRYWNVNKGMLCFFVANLWIRRVGKVFQKGLDPGPKTWTGNEFIKSDDMQWEKCPFCPDLE